MKIKYWYKKPHWWQFKKKRHYRELLQTTPYDFTKPHPLDRSKSRGNGKKVK